jgi:outer membrane protein OmpA-like peptidoglycan-associated protein
VPTDGTSYESVSGTVTLVVKKGKGKTRIIWFNPSAIVNPTPLSGTQLNAIASVPGSYSYSPSSGTVLAPGRHALNVKFIPNNQEENESLEANVTIEVRESANAKDPLVAPKAPISTPDTQTVTTPALKPAFKTDGEIEVVTVNPNQEKTGIVVSSDDWSFEIKSTTQFIQGTVEDTSARVVIEKGNTVTTRGTGFKPNSQVDVYVYSTPTWLGAVITDEFGNFSTTLPMPPSLPEGDHTFQAQGMTPDDRTRTAAVPITLVPATVAGKPGLLRFEVYFAMNSPIVSKSEKAKIARMVRMVNSKKTSTATVAVDVSGWVQPNPNPGNIKYLSTNRAKNVAAVLKSLGIKGKYTLKFPGLAKDNIPTARHATVVIKWSLSK